MKKLFKGKLAGTVWLLILVFFIIILTFPKWISMFYPEPHQEIVFSAANEFDVDPYLVFAIIRVESKYQTAAKSPAGALGLMQIMPETAKWIATQNQIEDFNLEDLHDPETNIRFGSWYLANLMQEYNEIPLVIAAYNAGRGKVATWINDEIWSGDTKELENIPFKETRIYVENVLKSYAAYRAIYQ